MRTGVELARLSSAARAYSFCFRFSLFLLAALAILPGGAIADDQIGDGAAYWESRVLWCEPGSGGAKFPSKESDDSAQPCGDAPKPPLNQWRYERENAEKAWESSRDWDRIFMAKMIADK